MTRNRRDLSALVSSRICHDLISPIGAIGNGVELLSMTSGASEELSLVENSVGSASTRVRFFRIAFGQAGDDQIVPNGEVRDILAGLSKGGRVMYHWNATSDLARADVKLAFLLALCAESALPFGGEIEVAAAQPGLAIIASGAEVRADAPVWAALEDGSESVAIDPPSVHFALAGDTLRERGLILRQEVGQGRLSLAVSI